MEKERERGGYIARADCDSVARELLSLLLYISAVGIYTQGVQGGGGGKIAYSLDYSTRQFNSSVHFAL